MLLGLAVCLRALLREGAAQQADIYDAAGGALLEMRQRRTTDGRDELRARLQQLVERLVAVDERRFRLQRKVVNENIDAAERRNGVLHQRRHPRRIHQVGNVAPDALDLPVVLFDAAIGAIDGEHTGAMLDQCPCHGLADAAGSARNQRPQPIQSQWFAHAVPLSAKYSPRPITRGTDSRRIAAAIQSS